MLGNVILNISNDRDPLSPGDQLNSIVTCTVIGVLTVIFSLAIAVPAAYAVSRLVLSKANLTLVLGVSWITNSDHDRSQLRPYRRSADQNQKQRRWVLDGLA